MLDAQLSGSLCTLRLDVCTLMRAKALKVHLPCCARRRQGSVTAWGIPYLIFRRAPTPAFVDCERTDSWLCGHWVRTTEWSCRLQQLLQALLLLLQQFTLYYCRLEPVVVVPIKDRVLQQCCLEPGGRVQEHERTDKRQPEKVKKENLSLLAKQQRAHTAHRTGHRELHTRTAHRGPPHKPDTLCALARHTRAPPGPRLFLRK